MTDIFNFDFNKNNSQENLYKKILELISQELNDESIKELNLTEEEIKLYEEYKKCKYDFFYFLKNYVPLSVTGKDIKFKPHLGQEILFSAFMKYNYIVVNKTRQIGITTVIRAIAAWVTNFYDNVGVGVVSKTGTAASDFIRETIKIIDSLPEGIKTSFVKKTEQQYILSNGSYAMAEPVSLSNPDKTLRSKPITLLIIDEAAFIAKLDIAMKGLFPTVSSTHKFARQYNIPYGIIIVSTPNQTTGKGSWFFRQYQAGIMNNKLYKNNPEMKVFRSIELWWKNIPYFTEDWYLMQVQMQNFDTYTIAQEYDCVFLPTAKDYEFDIDILIEMKKNILSPVKEIKYTGGSLQIFKEIDCKKFYSLTIDVATAYGSQAYSVIEIFDYDNDEQVAEYVGKLSTNDFPDVIKNVIQDLKLLNYVLLIENNTIGEPVINKLLKNESIKKNMYFTKIQDKDNPLVINKQYGLSTNSKTKPKIIESFFKFLKNNWNKIHSEIFYLQLSAMKIKGNEFVNKPNDTLMAVAFYAYLKMENFVESNGMKKNFYSEFKKSKETEEFKNNYKLLLDDSTKYNDIIDTEEIQKRKLSKNNKDSIFIKFLTD